MKTILLLVVLLVVVAGGFLLSKQFGTDEEFKIAIETKGVLEEDGTLTTKSVSMRMKKRSQEPEEIILKMPTCQIQDVKKHVDEQMVKYGGAPLKFYMPEGGCVYHGKVSKKKMHTKSFTAKHNLKRQHKYNFILEPTNPETGRNPISGTDGVSLASGIYIDGEPPQ